MTIGKVTPYKKNEKKNVVKGKEFYKHYMKHPSHEKKELKE